MHNAPPGGKLRDDIAFPRQHPVRRGKGAAVAFGHGVIRFGVRIDKIAHENRVLHGAGKVQKLRNALSSSA